MLTTRRAVDGYGTLEGGGEVRIGDSTYPLRAGDVIACPPGEADTAHQIVNTGSGELRYFAVSTTESPEVVDYPDSNKRALIHYPPPESGRPPDRWLWHLDAEPVDYWDGE